MVLSDSALPASMTARFQVVEADADPGITASRLRSSQSADLRASPQTLEIDEAGSGIAVATATRTQFALIIQPAIRCAFREQDQIAIVVVACLFDMISMCRHNGNRAIGKQ